MPVYDWKCRRCEERFERYLSLENFTEEVSHRCAGCDDFAVADLLVIPPAIERLENDCALSYNPMTGERISHGFHNYLVDGPNGDGSFSDRAEYKTWMKKQGLEETGGGIAKDIKSSLDKDRLLSGD